MIRLTYFNDEKYTFAQFMKVAMKQKGMGAIQLSEASNVSITAIRCYLHGDSMPTIPAVARICKALGYQLCAINEEDLKARAKKNDNK